MEWFLILKALKFTKVTTKLTEYKFLNLLFPKYTFSLTFVFDLGWLIMWQDC